ncbi:MAG: Vacuolar morphogenesis protein 6 [Alyxoria varia]|nr:MAG: Vacuolar morphogenesis protein 6 [Alyxoria varia]
MLLSAFKPTPITELKQRDKSKIESVLAYGDRLLVGLNTGVLRIYRVNEPQEDGEEELRQDQPRSSQEQSGTSKSKQRLVDLLREEEKFSRKPIQQLALIKEANLLVSHSDGCVSFHNLHDFTLAQRLEATKGATLFAATSNIVKDEGTNIASIVSRLAVAVKRKILVWTWQDMELSAEPTESVLPATVKCLSWVTGTKIITGMDPGFTLIDIESQEMTEINRPGPAAEPTGMAGTRFGAVNSSGMGYMGMGSWVPRPLATRLLEGNSLLAKDVNTLFIDAEGRALEKRQVPWATAPDAVGYSYPYLLSMSSFKGRLDIRNPDTLSLLQSINLPNVTHLHVPQPNISLAHAGKGFLVASERCIWRMEAIGYDSQINDLVEKQKFDEALSLVGMLEETLLDNKPGRLREIKIQKAQSLFERQRYREALDLFSEASTHPERVISLYPESIAGEVSSDHGAEDDAERKEDDENLEREAPNAISTDQSSSKGTPSKIRNSKAQDNDKASIKSSTDDDTTASETPRKAIGKGKNLMLAVQELCAFLAQTRVQVQKYISFSGTLKEAAVTSIQDSDPKTNPPPFQYLVSQSVLDRITEAENDQDEGIDTRHEWQRSLLETATLVDTTLFRAYMFARPRLAGSLFRLDNFCVPSVVKDKLYETGRYVDLIEFLHGKRLHREALELLEKFGKAEEEENANKTGEDEVTNGTATKQVDESLRGPRRTVAYLQQLPFELIDLILEYARWPLQVNPRMGMEIFTADSENAETLPRDRVLQFLMQINPNLGLQYLEHVIDDLGDDTPEFHDQLIELYMEKVNHEASLRKESSRSDTQPGSWQERLEMFLERNPTYYTSRALIYRHLNQHRHALQIYIFDLHSPTKAEQYCNSVYRSSTPSNTTTTSPTSFLTSLLHQPTLQTQTQSQTRSKRLPPPPPAISHAHTRSNSGSKTSTITSPTSPPTSPTKQQILRRANTASTSSRTSEQQPPLIGESEEEAQAEKDPSQIYTILLRLYLNPPPHSKQQTQKPSHQPQPQPQTQPQQPQDPHQPAHAQHLTPALDLLAKHAPRIPLTPHLLHSLPPDLSLAKLEQYVVARVRAGVAREREIGIVKGLAGVEKSRVERDLLIGSPSRGGDEVWMGGPDRENGGGLHERYGGPGGGLNEGSWHEKDGTTPSNGRNRRIVLSESSTCGVCRRRFGRAAVRVLGDGSVVHYGCGGGGAGGSGGAGAFATRGGFEDTAATPLMGAGAAAAGGPRILGR